MGLILRIGEYLREFAPQQGILLKQRALDSLRRMEPTINDRVLEQLMGEECAEILDAVERQDDEALRFHFEDGEQRQRIRKLVCEGTCGRMSKGADYLPVPLPVGLLREARD